MLCVMARTRNLRVLVNDDEKKMVRELAEKHGLTMADYLRQLIRREHRKVFPAHPGKKR